MLFNSFCESLKRKILLGQSVTAEDRLARIAASKRASSTKFFIDTNSFLIINCELACFLKNQGCKRVSSNCS
jgi:hypothetical protein